MNIKRYFNKYFLYDLKYKIRCFFKPQNKWATDCIPNYWRDKDGIIEDVLFAAIVHLVEDEKIFEMLDLTHTEEHKKFAAELKAAYNWITWEKPLMELQLTEAYPPINVDSIIKMKEFTPTTEQISMYDKVNQLEQALDTKNTEYLRWIVENRKQLWT